MLPLVGKKLDDRIKLAPQQNGKKISCIQPLLMSYVCFYDRRRLATCHNQRLHHPKPMADSTIDINFVYIILHSKLIQNRISQISTTMCKSCTTLFHSPLFPPMISSKTADFFVDPTIFFVLMWVFMLILILHGAMKQYTRTRAFLLA